MKGAALIDRLHDERCSCVIAQGDAVRTFTRRGVADLYGLLHDEPAFLKGACVADKVIGKAAAAILVKAGVAEVYADVISRPARELLEQAGVQVTWASEADHIINRSRTGWCPLETLCLPETDVDRMLLLITRFLQTNAGRVSSGA